MILLRYCLFILAMFGLCSEKSLGQQQPRIPFWWGGGIGYMYGLHSTDGNLRCLNDPSCPQYNDGTGHGLMVGASADWRLSSGFGLLGRLHLTLPSAEMTAENSSGLVKNQNGDIVPLVRSHSLQASLTSIRLDINGNLLLGKFRIFGGFAPEVLISPTWSSTSSIVSPSNVTFGNKLRDTTFLTDAAITDASGLVMSASFGIGYDIPLGLRTMLTPELTGTLPLTPIVSNGSWKQTTIALTAHIRFGSGIVKTNESRIRELIDTVKVRDNSFVGTRFVQGNKITVRNIEETETARIVSETVSRHDTLFIGNDPPKGPAARIEVYAVGGESAGKQVQEIVLSGRYVTEAFPVIPTVFFESNNAQLPVRYKHITSPQDFSTDALVPNSLIQHRDVLNIIGKRLQENPRAKLTVRGTADPTTEDSDCGLAERRAETVKQYLVQSWGIDEKRIRNRTPRRRCEPENPTTSQVEEGYADNRRVEIDSEDDDILEPLLRTRFIEVIKTEPKEFEVRIKDDNSSQIAEWTAKARLQKNTLFSESKNGQPTGIRHTLSDDEIRSLTNNRDAMIEIDASLTDKTNNSDEQSITLPVRHDTTEFSIQRLSLMTFDVLKDNLNRSAKKAIKRFVEELDEQSTISVSGYTDKLGDPDLNTRLAVSRANAVADYIKDIKPNANIVNNVGYGSTKMPPGLGTDTLPEARFLSRTVQIEILRRIK